MVAVLIHRGGKSPQNTEFNDSTYTPLMWECPGAFPGIGSFTFIALSIMGHFRGLWWFITPSKTWQLSLRSAQLRQLCPIKRVEYLQVNVPISPSERSFHTWASCVRAETGMTKERYPTLKDLFLIGLFPPLGQNPAFSLWWWVCTPFAPGLSPWTPSAKHPLLCQMANSLRPWPSTF